MICRVESLDVRGCSIADESGPAGCTKLRGGQERGRDGEDQMFADSICRLQLAMQAADRPHFFTGVATVCRDLTVNFLRCGRGLVFVVSREQHAMHHQSSLFRFLSLQRQPKVVPRGPTEKLTPLQNRLRSEVLQSCST